MKKKLLSLVMAVAMILSLAAPAFATNYYTFNTTDTSKQNKNEQTVKFPAKMFVPTVKLTLPNLSTTDALVLNPYRIEYVSTNSATNYLNTVSASTNAVTSANYNEQVICPIYAIKNQTNAKMNVKAKAETSVSGNLVLETGNHVGLKETGTKAMINFIVKKQSVNSAAYASAPYAISVGSAMGSLDAYDTANNTVIKLAATNAEQKVATMNNAMLEGGENYLLFQFGGELSREPSTPWTASDKFTTTVVFTFSPVAIADALAVYTKDDLAKDSPGALTVKLPKIDSGSLSLNDGFTSFTKNPAASGWTLSLHETAPAWDMVDGGSLSATITGTGNSATLTVSADNMAKLPADGNLYPYTCVIGFADKYGVPRTVEVTLNLKRLATT